MRGKKMEKLLCSNIFWYKGHLTFNYPLQYAKRYRVTQLQGKQTALYTYVVGVISWAMKGAVLLLIFANELVLAHIILISVHSLDAFVLI